MITEIKLPKLSRTMEDAAVVEVIVHIGDEVKQGDNIFEIETDKACVEVQSQHNGFVRHIFIEPGQVVPVGATVMILGGKDEQVPQRLIDELKRKLPSSQMPISSNEPAAKEVSVSFAGDNSKTISSRDIKLGSVVPLSFFQKMTARRMLKSKSEIPAFYLNVSVDVTNLVELRNKLCEEASLKLSYNDFFIKAVAEAVRCFPLMAGVLAGEVIQLPQVINVGLATSIADCLYVPVIRQADKKSIQEIAQDRIRLVEKAQAHELSPEDLEGASITISNLGPFGVDWFIPIVIPGQCCIVGIGRIMEQPVPDDSGIAVRKVMNVTISVDHRIANGSYASEFLDFMRKYLQNLYS